MLPWVLLQPRFCAALHMTDFCGAFGDLNDTGPSTS